jgi:8-oxo-dGTP diphosphatase
MQHRASWTSDGDTWALPGGARDSDETAVQAALREAAEEAGIDSTAVLVTGEYIDDHGGWAYTTVLAEAVRTVTVLANAESAELRWVLEDDVDRLDLHSGFARSWPALFRGDTNP